MGTQELRSMLDRIPGIRHACELDLVLFFYRHPRALLTGEKLVAYLGYDPERVATSLEGLIEAGLLTRSLRSRGARLYVLALESVPGGLLSSFLKIVATRPGRQEAMQLLNSRPDHATRSDHGQA